MTPARLQPIDAELTGPVPAAVAGFAADLAARHGSVEAVLFYGSSLRSGSLTDSLLDFYLIVGSYARAHGSRTAALANRLLPPNVYYAEWTAADGARLRCKYAIISRRDLARRCRPQALDVSIWARFAQPTRCVWQRDEAALMAVNAALAQAAQTALASVAPATDPLEQWAAVFAQTYRCELRAERAGKGGQIVAMNAGYYRAVSASLALRQAQDERMAAPALRQAQDERVAAPALRQAQDERGVPDPTEPLILSLSKGERAPVSLSEKAPSPIDERAPVHGRSSGWWWRRRWFGRIQHLARLIKASFTFTGGVDYLAWKITRHSGIPITLTDWQRRHPILGGAGLLVSLLRRGAIR